MRSISMSGREPYLRDDLQDIEDELHDHRTLTQLTRPAVDHWDQGAVQITQVLREQGLSVTTCQVTHLRDKNPDECEQKHLINTNYTDFSN